MVAGGDARRKVAGATEACKETSPDDSGSDREHSRSVAGLAFRRAWRDMARSLDSVTRAGQSLFHIGMRVLGPCLVVMALSLKGFVTYTYFWHGRPILQERAGFIGSSLLSFLGVFLLANALYNYFKAVFTPAGLPPEFEQAKVSLMESSENPEVVPRKCPKCARLKPPRAHHCSICGVCVLKMDHHCPWINNCVGFGNYRYFCLFLLFLAMACLFIVCVFGTFFYDIIFTWARQGTRVFRQCILTSFMICASILAAVCFLGGFHTFLVLTNQTTIDFQINMMRRRESRYNGEFFRNPYDMGRSRNCQEVFGPNRLWSFIWLFPWMGALPPTGDGMKFATISRLQI